MKKVTVLKRVLFVLATSTLATTATPASLRATDSVDNKSVTFTFAPKDGMLYLQNLTSTRERVLKNGQKQIEETIATVKVQIKKTNYGWEVNTIPIELQMKRDGEDIINPLARLITYGEKTYKLDKSGKIKDIVGYNSMLEKIKNQFSEKEIQGFKSILDIETLKQKDMQEWNGRIGNFLGTTVLLGEKTTGKIPTALPDGKQVNYTVNTHYRGMESCAQSRCVRIKQSYNSETNTADKGVLEQSQTVASKVPVANYLTQANVATVKGSVTRLIDPQTMLIYEEIVERKTNHNPDLKTQQGLPVKTTEKRIYKYDY